ncbi:hypothetical protein BU15DRAFT_79761 [Melanogaster broomeanus]|nr:hypothetical protein BU15DRAFT_79761 [Melanogaster broomeanus]
MRVPNGIVDDPGGRVKPSTSQRPPSTLLEGERGHEPSSSRAEDPGRRMGQEDAHATTNRHNGKAQSLPLEGERDGSASGSDDEPKVELEGGRMHASTAPPNASAKVVHAHANTPSTPTEGEEGRKREQARSAMKKNEIDQRTSRVNEDSPRAPPEPPPPITNHPERSCDDAVESNEPGSARTSTDVRNEPGSEIAAPGDQGSEWECSTSDPIEEVRVDEGHRGGQSEGDSSRRDHSPSSDDGTTSNAGRKSGRLAPKLLAEDEPSQHKDQDRITRNVPGPPQSPTNDHANRPTKPVNPPRRRGRLKTRPARIRQARAYAPAEYSRVGTLPGPIQPVGCIGYAPEMPGECPRPARTKAEGPRAQHTRTAHPPSPGNARRAANYHIE